jgi:mRNA-degrading endonuclease RelE of RelBE toxin-antitoxin system
MDGLGIETCASRVKKIARKAQKGKGLIPGLRLIYAYLSEEQRVTCIEWYHKSDKEHEDRNRMTQHFR